MWFYNECYLSNGNCLCLEENIFHVLECWEKITSFEVVHVHHL